MIKKIFLIISISIITILIIYGFVRLTTIGQMGYIEIDKSDANLGIKMSDALLAAKEREKQFKESQGKELIENESNLELDKVETLDNVETELFQILLLGSDSRSKNIKGSRTDAIMLVTIDFKNKDIKLSSFLRDLKVKIKGKTDKLTHAYSYGGGEETIRVLNENFELDIRDFAVVSMFDLRTIIDSIGGLDLEVTEAERQEINYRVKEIADIEGRKDYKFLKEKGFQHLNGEQIVAYGRIRNTAGGDYARTDRQREVISLIIEAMKGKNLIELVGISNNLFPLISTTLTTSEIENKLLKVVSGGIDYKIKSTRFPSDDLIYSDMSTGVYYAAITDKDKFIEELHDFIYNN